MNTLNPKVDEYLKKAKNWQEEMELLRKILLDCGLDEDYKWIKPCYSFNDGNVVIIVPFKEYCALGFFKGSLLNDTEGILVKPGENSQAGRQLRFRSKQEIEESELIIKSYIFEAVEVEKAGLEVALKKTTDFDIPEELQFIMDKLPDFKIAFEALTPGRQRAYILHFSQPKQSATRTSRIENSMERIYSGKGLNDCICGFSHRKPNCDGTHKHYR